MDNSVQRMEWWHQKYHKDAAVVDLVMEQYDTNNDGFVSFVEYMTMKDSIRVKV